jgi:hypothetical protein
LVSGKVVDTSTAALTAQRDRPRMAEWKLWRPSSAQAL